MEYNSDFFYRTKKGLKFIITDKDIDIIRKLISKKADNSGYTPDGLMLQWRYEDNKHLVKDTDELSRLYVIMQFITMTGELTTEFKNKYNVKSYHESLLRGLYLDFNNWDGCEITTALKRPFGNSWVLGDVAEHLIKNGVSIDRQNLEDTNNDGILCRNVYFEFISILDNFIKEFNLKYRIFVSNGNSFGMNKSDLLNPNFSWNKYISGNHRLHSYMNSWILDESELRDEKIEILIC
jgi:hypothetical protein